MVVINQKGNSDMNISKLSMSNPSFRANLEQEDFEDMWLSARYYAVP